jgi:hypothetical protein
MATSLKLLLSWGLLGLRCIGDWRSLECKINHILCENLDVEMMTQTD